MTEDTYEGPGGPVTIAPIDHASLVIRYGSEAIYVDPVGGIALYDDQPRPTAILITHEHGDHLDLPTLEALTAGRKIPMIVNGSVYPLLPPELQRNATMLRNGEAGEVSGLRVEAIAAYNTSPGKEKYHPPGVGNGYVLAPNGLRIYIPSDGEPTPEMKALKNIDIAFLPMNQPYTMTPEQAAEAIVAFRPRYAYPFHYRGTPPEALNALIPQDFGTEIKIRDWYARRTG
jgi:L-ascorbate metabolism protein UlaG (beta-lactamase superfamily)